MFTSEFFSISLTSFTLIGLAELGDKSQLVCMTLASRYRHWPVLLGAAIAFTLLNALAVVFGAGVAAWLPERVTAAIVAILFGIFGIHALLSNDTDESEVVVEQSGRSIFLTTLALLFVAEFGDKTQIAVAGLAGSTSPAPVWIGASIALILVSALGIWAGRTLLQRLPMNWLHRTGGVIFLTFSLVAAWKVFF
ncbi:MAG: TMEM165/GDT1 family protein [Chromatiales bacterium]|jgi:putative Ca2+/H+ antiporter (TMEM165/GDT1 family)